MPKKLNIIGQRFGRLIVKYEIEKNKYNKRRYVCQCDCGNKKIILGDSLLYNKTKSCGCINRERLQNRCGENHHNYIDGRKYDKEYKKKYMAEYYKENRDELLKDRKSYFEKNKDKIAEREKKYRQENPEKDAKQSAKRRATKQNQTPILTENEKRKIGLYYQISQYLGSWAHVDHIQPLSKGGLHHPDNLQVLDAKLNMEKHNKWPLTETEKIKYKGIRI